MMDWLYLVSAIAVAMVAVDVGRHVVSGMQYRARCKRYGIPTREEYFAAEKARAADAEG